MHINILTLFPEWVQKLATEGVVQRARTRGIFSLNVINPRDFAGRKDGRIDGRPFGGGPGMVMEAEPLFLALQSLHSQKNIISNNISQNNFQNIINKNIIENKNQKNVVIFLTPDGEKFNQSWAEILRHFDQITFVCGRYEGFDARLLETLEQNPAQICTFYDQNSANFDENAEKNTPQILRLSLGDFVLSGGELAALTMLDAVIRLLPNALGDTESAPQDSFHAENQGLLDHPHFTKPTVWRDHAAPKVLLSGDHRAIARWRLKQSLGQSWIKRPDLLDNMRLDSAQVTLLREFVLEFCQNIIEP